MGPPASMNLVRRVTTQDIQAAAGNWSIEVTPSASARVDSFASILTPRTTVNVTSLPRTDPFEAVAVAERLFSEGMRPVPHIAARSMRDKAQLGSLLDAFTKRAGVDEVLLVGGGASQPAGDFDSSLQILESGVLQRHGILHVGVSGHPEGSPDISDAAIRGALLAKTRLARREGLNMYIATQFCFEAQGVLEWERRVRDMGIELPIRVGIPGPATVQALLRFARLSGVGPSMRFISAQAHNIAKLMTVQSPDRLLADLSLGMAQDPECRIERFHFYAFGGFAETAKYARAVADGAFQVRGDGGFDVTGL